MSRSRDKRLKDGGCNNQYGTPKIRWPNAQTAIWYRDNQTFLHTLKKCEAYDCPRCGFIHLGRSKQKKWRMPGHFYLQLYVVAQSMYPQGDE